MLVMNFSCVSEGYGFCLHTSIPQNGGGVWFPEPELLLMFPVYEIRTSCSIWIR